MSRVWSNEGDPESEYMGDDSHMYEDSIDLVYKGVETDFDRIFQAFKVIDFSGNRLYGHIPGSIGLLSELRLLNLSGNAFTGNIPPSLANITKLETLDISRNNLSGEIPQGLGNLSFLSNINFSHNHLARSFKVKTVLHSWVTTDSMDSRKFVKASMSMSPFLHRSHQMNLCRIQKSQC